jgi:hypothetical protein
MHKHTDWVAVASLVLPYILPIISYAIGHSKGRLQIPAKVRAWANNPDVKAVVTKGIATAQSMQNMTDEQKREYVRAWAKSELFGILGEWIPDSSLNWLIEHMIVQQKE